jgi:gliding motility-associated-like protein
LKFKYPLFVFITLYNFAQIYAQLNATVIGDAIDQGNNCYIITQDQEFQSGGVWYDNPIDFDSDFTIFYQNDFGNQDFDGADGMALVFKREATPEIGGAGGGLGYQGITPSLIVEFDTYQNTEIGDPFWDHIAIMRDGNPDHDLAFSNLAGPVQASLTNPNIEDGNSHEVRIEWSATAQELRVFFDCQLRLTLNQDIKRTIFSQDDTVYFGFVGSTGGLTNIHQVCFNSISFVDNLQLQDETICLGNTINVDATIPSGTVYNWTPTNGVSNPSIPNPDLSPTATTTYTVTISDVCGETTTEELTITVQPVINTIPVFDSVPPICSGDTLEELPTTSNDGITGVWSPEINNTMSTLYTFTPDNPCATSATLIIIINPIEVPVFDPIEAICVGDMLTDLPTVSTNGISGSWLPALNNMNTTTYTFTPDDDEICVAETTLEIVVNPIVVPAFDSISAACEGDSLNALPTTSNNGISGTWSPSLNNTITTTYTFTPNAEECATPTTLEIIINPSVMPIFDSVSAICEGENLPELSTLSNNGISGTWSPELDNSTTTTYTFTPSTGECAFTTTLEIEVIPNEIPIFDAVNPICPGGFLEELPTSSSNGYTGLWSPALNNMETTTYTFTPDSNQGCVEPITLEIIVTDPIIPTFDVVTTVCEGDTVVDLPATSIEGITGIWSPAFNNMETTVYTFTPDGGQCASETTLEIQVIPISQLEIEVEVVSEPFSDNQTIVAAVAGGTGLYEFQLDDGLWLEENTFSGVTGCDEHVLRVREVSGCSNTAVETFRILEYPKFFTPNGDAENDRWNIDCLKAQASARISIFDRYGKIVAVIYPSRSGWDGVYNGAFMPTNDYWFKVEYFSEDGLPRVFTSHFTLKR